MNSNRIVMMMMVVAVVVMCVCVCDERKRDYEFKRVGGDTGGPRERRKCNRVHTNEIKRK